MKRSPFSFLLPFVASVVATACGSGGPSFSVLHHPVDVAASSADLLFKGETTRFAYVADRYSGGIVVLDLRRDEIVDTDLHSDFDDNLLPVGGEPISVAVIDREGIPRVFVADDLGRSLHAFDAVPSADGDSDVLRHTPVNLGGDRTGVASRPLFRDNGGESDPVLAGVTVSAETARNENWRLEYEEGDREYRVEGSRSGEQAARAREGTPYTSDDGALSFTIVSGGNPTDDGDRFEFAAAVSRPKALPAIPVDLDTDGTLLFVLLVDITAVPTEGALLVLDPESGETVQSVPLTDPLGGDVAPTALAVGEGHLYVSNGAGDGFFDVDASTWTAMPMTPGVRARSLGFDPATNTLFFLSLTERTAVPFSLEEETLLPPVPLSDYGFGFTPYTYEGNSFALVPTAGGGTDVLETLSRGRVDTNVTNDDPQSEMFDDEFYDLPPRSSPELISVNTKDGTTLAERWQLTYEGVVPGTEGIEVSIAGDLLTAAEASFVTGQGIEEGDLLVIEPYAGAEELEIAEVVSETELRLAAEPEKQGTREIEILAGEAYIVVGSISGPQFGRAKEGVSYTSDGGEISLSIRSSRSEPTTRGDFFTFLTTDGIEPLGGHQKRLARKAFVFQPPDDEDLTAYVVQAASGSVSVLNLRTLEQRRTIP